MTERKDSQMSPQDRERDRDRSQRQSRFADANSKGEAYDRDRSRERRSASNRIYVSNIPYEYRRQDLKNLCQDSSSNDKDYNEPYNTYGLSTSFLEGLGIFGPLHTKVFVTNLDDKVDAKKLEQVFKLAGRVVSVDLSTDKDGNSRGFAVVVYDHPVEAVQAISMLHHQTFYDRRMTVRLDHVLDKNDGIKLPEGLEGLGIGLGSNGEPLRDVTRNFPILQQQQNQLQPLQQNNPPVPVTPPNSLNGPSYWFLCLVIISAVSARMLSYLLDLSKFAATL